MFFSFHKEIDQESFSLEMELKGITTSIFSFLHKVAKTAEENKTFLGSSTLTAPIFQRDISPFVQRSSKTQGHLFLISQECL